MEPQQKEKPIPLEYMAAQASSNGRLTTRRICMGCAISVLLVLLAFGTTSAGYPRIYAPCNLPVFVLMLGMDWAPKRLVGLLAAAPVAVLFWIWCLPVLRGSPRVPKRSLILLACAGTLSAANLVGGYQYANQYYGFGYVVGVAIISVVFWVSLGALALVAWKYPSSGRNLLFHVVLFAWLAWYVLPHLGELP